MRVDEAAYTIRVKGTVKPFKTNTYASHRGTYSIRIWYMGRRMYLRVSERSSPWLEYFFKRSSPTWERYKGIIDKNDV